MSPLDPTILSDVSDTSSEGGDDACMDLAEALSANWLNPEKVISMMDITHSGIILYDDFFDSLNQFGLADKVDLEKVFNHLAKGEEGFKPAEILGELNKAMEVVTAFHTSIAKKEHRSSVVSRHGKMVALVAHNNMKPSMMNFVSQHIQFFKKCKLVTTGSTGRSLGALGLNVEQLVSSGPLGGDQQIGGMISQGDVAAVFFFTDPLSAHPHDDDIKALIRICAVHDCITATNPSTGNALVFALENSAFGLSRLMGVNPSMGADSDVVQKYLENQKAVIQSVSSAVSTGKETADSVSLATFIEEPTEEAAAAEEAAEAEEAANFVEELPSTKESRFNKRMTNRRSSTIGFLRAGADESHAAAIEAAAIEKKTRKKGPVFKVQRNLLKMTSKVFGRDK
jgi:methylglyoxal synthase